MTKENLKNIEIPNRKLGKEHTNIERPAHFFEQCTTFNLDDQAIIERIVKLISAIEDEEYVYHTFTFTEAGHFVTESSSYLEDLIGVIDYHEVMEERTFYQKWIEPKTYNSQRIVSKSACDSFSKINCTTIDEYMNCLNKFLIDQKHFVFKEEFSPEDFYKQFPYVTKYLESLVYWRLKNHTLTIPEEVMDALLTIPDKPDEMKLNKRPLK